jgi:hypothetical protein
VDETAGGDIVEPVSSLAALILDVQRRFEEENHVPLTHSDIARRSGLELTRGQVQAWATKRIKQMPAPDTLASLAKGLGIHVAEVTRRALLDAGYEDPSTYGLAARRGRPVKLEGKDEQGL